MKTKVLLFRDAVSIVLSKLKLLSFVLNSPNISRKAIPQRATSIRGTFTNRNRYRVSNVFHSMSEISSSIN